VSRFVVTGATGFIGSAVVRRLLAEGHSVVAVTSSGKIADARVDWRKLDLLQAGEGELAELVAEAGASRCIHAAWYTNHADYLVHEVNREWLAASVRLARACSGLRLVTLGTCLEYDFSEERPCAEDVTPLAPETLYARCKRDLFETLQRADSDGAWARVFFVYGPGDREGRLIPKMLESFARGEAAGPTYGALRRDYIHVDDLAAQIVRIALADVRGAINTGTGEAPTLSEIFVAGARAIGTPELAQQNDRTDGQPLLIAADLAKFRDEVGAPEARTIEEGLAGLVSARPAPESNG
jgi:nucleoside-diphosphate-sugar epimerase